ncbi:MAG: RidA family protein [Thermoplasmata archaeon]
MAPSRRSTHPLPRERVRDDRTRYASGTPWEPKVGYSRAVRVGRRIYVSGTTATAPDGSVVGRGDAYAQTVQTLDNIERALTALGSRREEIVRVRVYVTDMGDFEAIARALGERFGEVRPANTLVQVAALIDPAMKVEIDADAEVPADH